MALDFEEDAGRMWALCDNSCSGQSNILEIAQTGVHDGKFVVTNAYNRPTDMPNLNNEGFTTTPNVECVAGKKPVFWTDDSDTGGFALRAGTLNC
jgi:hypothetical protein